MLLILKLNTLKLNNIQSRDIIFIVCESLHILNMLHFLNIKITLKYSHTFDLARRDNPLTWLCVRALSGEVRGGCSRVLISYGRFMFLLAPTATSSREHDTVSVGEYLSYVQLFSLAHF